MLGRRLPQLTSALRGSGLRRFSLPLFQQEEEPDYAVRVCL